MSMGRTFRRKHQELLRKPCNYCGRMLIRDDIKNELYHEAPVCEEFHRLITGHGGVAMPAMTLDEVIRQRSN